MKYLLLTSTSPYTEEPNILVNWDKVSYLKECKNPYGDAYTEINTDGGHSIEVRESVIQMESQLSDK